MVFAISTNEREYTSIIEINLNYLMTLDLRVARKEIRRRYAKKNRYFTTNYPLNRTGTYVLIIETNVLYLAEGKSEKVGDVLYGGYEKTDPLPRVT